MAPDVPPGARRWLYNCPSLIQPGQQMAVSGAASGFNYGSDKSGLVWGFLIDPGATAAPGAVPTATPIGAADALRWMAAPHPGQFI